MLNRRISLPGLLAVLFALMAQLGAAASVPQVNPLFGMEALCHANEGSGGQPAPAHVPDCLFCPFCVALHAPVAILTLGPVAIDPPGLVLVSRAGLPPPSTAPPAAFRPPSQPRAPPTVS